MINRCRWFAAALMAVFIGTTGCKGPRTERVPTVHVDVDEGKVDVVDHYLEIDRRAFQGVDKAIAKKALGGDGPTAVGIGNAFAHANHLSEARFWYQIAAENGDAIGMNNFSILVRDLDCHRGNYWFRKALHTGGLGKESEASMRRSLKEYEASCK